MTRVQLRDQLEKLGVQLYYQEPGKDQMKFPCIVYSMSNPKVDKADNAIYNRTNKYNVTYITNKVDDPMSDILLESFMYMALDRISKIENRYHYFYTLYY